MEKEMSWVDKTMKNMDTVLAANRKLHEKHLHGVEKQKAIAGASMHRCRRCGDITVGIFPELSLARVCSECERELRSTDGEALWFCEMVGRINSGKEDQASR
jgi:hypothetical protein